MRSLTLPWILASAGELPSDAVPAAEVAQANAQRVVAAAIAVEKEMEKIINARVTGRPTETNAYFAQNILGADWFSFSAKRKLVLQILSEYDHLRGADKGDIERLLRSVMSLRNKFAHGTLLAKNGELYVTYFESKAREDRLSDEYWAEVEAVFERTIKLLVAGQKSMGIVPGWGGG